jgi:thiosulfate/3-mercaptopyruvate sulfurtransferase
VFNRGVSALIGAAELAACLDDVVVIDCQWTLGGPPGRFDFERAHLPAAAHLDLDAELAGPPGARGRHPLPEPHVIEAALRRSGVDDGDHVVVYDAQTSMAAARAWWVLRWAGLGSVRVLDGGLAAWMAAGFAVHEGPQSPRPAGSVTVRPGSVEVLDAARAGVFAATGVLLDARATERYLGESEPIDAVAGHIPGALSAPTTDNLDPSGRFRPAAELQERFAAYGIAPETAVACYCGSGVTAAHEALALHEAGVEAVVYVGSWSEWITDPERPVATGPAR